MPQRLEQLRAIWRGRLRSPVFWCSFWGLLLTIVALSQLARVGSSAARLTSGLLLTGILLGLAIVAWREGRVLADPRRVIRRVLFAVSRPLGEKVLRAHGLVSDGHPGESEELARAHYERLLGQASEALVDGAARRRARLWRTGWILFAVGSLISALLIPFRVVEGLDVLVARGGRAPLSLSYLEDYVVTAELPSYLRDGRRTLVLTPAVSTTLPEGSVVTLRGAVRLGGRDLVLTDSLEEVPLVSDGQGGVVAHFTLREPAELRVAARFGDVRVFDPFEIRMDALPDRAPIVTLEGAPRTEELGGLSRLELNFVASDDYGLDQIDLVLRSGRHEERRPLVKLSGEERVVRSGHALTPDDPFLRRAFLPVAVTIEAKDNDTASGPKWGRSAAITLSPPPVGSQEAARYAALKALRGTLVDLVALDRTTRELPTSERAGAMQKAYDAIDQALSRSLRERPGGLEVSRGARHFLEAQVEGLGSKRKSSPDHVLLAVDVLLQHLSTKEARSVAKRLGDVVEELGVRTRLLRDDTEYDPETLAVVLEFARSGSGALGQLGVLGRDLGSVARGDLGRIQRLLEVKDLRRAEQVALHLASRLRHAEPSFGSTGGAGGVESGMPGQGQGSGDASPSEAPSDFDQMAEQIDELALDHAQQMSELERLLQEAEAAARLDDQRGDARSRAEELREAVAQLPEVGADPGTARAAAAEGRAHAEAMADSLERLDLEQTVESGKRALDALEEAARRRGEGYGSWLNAEDLEQARQRVREELGRAQRELRQLSERARDAMRGGLSERAQREQELARRAQELARRGRDQAAPLPGELTEQLEEAARLMQKAAQELGEGNADRARELQQEAQRQLEQSRPGRAQQMDGSPSEEESSGGEPSDRGLMDREGEVPEARQKNAAEAFRQRLQRGLGQPSGRLSPAVRRYAEALQ